MIPAENKNFVGEGLGYLTSEYSGENAPQLQGLISAFLNRAQELETALWQIINLRQLANLVVYNPLVGTFDVQNGVTNGTCTVDQTGIIIPGLTSLTFSSQPGVSYPVNYLSPNGQYIGFGPYTGTTDANATATQNLQNSLMDTVGELVGQNRLGYDDLDFLSTIYLRIAVNRSFAVPPNWSNFAAILLKTASGPAYYQEGRASFRLSVWGMELSPIATATVLAGAVTNGVLGEFGYSTWPDGSDFSFSSRYYSSAGQLGWGSRYDSSVGGLLVACSGLPPGG